MDYRQTQPFIDHNHYRLTEPFDDKTQVYRLTDPYKHGYKNSITVLNKYLYTYDVKPIRLTIIFELNP